jgi:ADP-heptose:LPS heptosyltransferase
MSSSNPTRRFQRRVNRRFYRCLLRFYRSVFPTPSWAGRLPAAAVRRVLIVRHDHVGDMVATTPLIAFLKEHLPAAEIDVLASPSSARLIVEDDRVAHVFLNDHRWPTWLGVLPRLRARRYDVVFSLVYGRGLREGMAASLIAHRGTYKLSAWRPARYVGFFTTVARPPRSAQHMADQLLYVGYHALGIRWPGARDAAARYPMRVAVPDASDARVSAFLSARRTQRFVVVNLAATDASREWRPEPCARFVAAVLARHADISVVLPPPPDKEADAQEVTRLCGSPRVVVAAALPLLDLAALLRHALMVVTPDTGVLHLASACGRPVLALYTPTSVHLERWLPWGVPYRYLMAGRGELVSDIQPERIVAAFEEFYDEIGQPTAASGAAP